MTRDQSQVRLARPMGESQPENKQGKQDTEGEGERENTRDSEQKLG